MGQRKVSRPRFRRLSREFESRYSNGVFLARLRAAEGRRELGPQEVVPGSEAPQKKNRETAKNQGAVAVTRASCDT